MSLVIHVWRNFKSFWNSQVFWTLVAAMIAAAWQYHKGLFSGTVKDNLWAIVVPYVGIAGLFLVVNIGHAILRAEWRALKRRQHQENRAERKAEIERSKPSVPKPNLQFRRIFSDRTYFGHEISGHSCYTVLLEVGNELADRVVGTARNIRAHVTYLDKTRKQLQIRCPVSWVGHERKETIPPGESRVLILAVLQAAWLTDLYDGLPLPEDGATAEVRFLDESGQLLTDLMSFELRLRNGINPSLTMRTVPLSP